MGRPLLQRKWWGAGRRAQEQRLWPGPLSPALQEGFPKTEDVFEKLQFCETKLLHLSRMMLDLPSDRFSPDESNEVSLLWLQAAVTAFMLGQEPEGFPARWWKCAPEM